MSRIVRTREGEFVVHGAGERRSDLARVGFADDQALRQFVSRLLQDPANREVARDLLLERRIAQESSSFFEPDSPPLCSEEDLLEEFMAAVGNGEIRLRHGSRTTRWVTPLAAGGPAGPATVEADALGGAGAPAQAGASQPGAEKEEVRLVSIDPTGDRKAFVNLGSGKEDGRFVRITAQVEPKTAGVAVYFFLDQLGSLHPDEKELSDRTAGFSASVGANAPVTVKATTDKKGEARTTLRLSDYGGDRWKVLASLSEKKDSTGGLSTGTFEIWRKVFLELNTMAAAPDGTNHRLDLTNMTSEYRRAYIEVVEAPPEDEIPYKDRCTDSYILETLRAYYGAEHSPNQIAVLLGSLVGEKSKKVLEAPAETGKTMFDHVFLPWEADKWLSWGIATGWRKTSLFGREFHLPHVRFLSADNLKLVAAGVGEYCCVVADIQGLGFDLTPPHKVNLKASIYTVEQYGVAFSGTPFLCIPVGSVRRGNWSVDKRSEEEVAEGILVHEIGHKVLMVPTGTKYAYTHPGQGTHCMAPDSPKKAGVYDEKGLHNCTMHHSALGLKKFCDTCVRLLRANQIRGDDVGWSGKRGPKAGAPGA
jgi:hypothetical protein